MEEQRIAHEAPNDSIETKYFFCLPSDTNNFLRRSESNWHEQWWSSTHVEVCKPESGQSTHEKGDKEILEKTINDHLPLPLIIATDSADLNIRL